jgi:hypothetical protein
MGKAKLHIERSFHRNGMLREETSFLGRQTHGPRRTWHPNGRIASEEFYEHDLLHGLCRQWNRRGGLLGSFAMRHGTGIQREWFENGQPQFEASMVNGKFTGRIRTWLQDGTQVSEQFAIENRNVTPDAYAKIAAQHPEYPRYALRRSKTKFPSAEEIERREFQLQVKSLLTRQSHQEAVAWLDGGTTKRSLGLFKPTQALRLIKSLYDSGARKVLAVKIYSGESGKQFSDAILVKLPPEKSSRLNIRRTLGKLPAKLRAGVLPAQDQGEDYLFASFV